MKVLKERVAFLLDYEVLEHLNGLKEKYNWTFTPQEEKDSKSKRKRFTGAGLDLEVITRDITLCLGKLAAGEIPNTEAVMEIMTFLNQYELMKVEKLQILNSLPRSMVHLYALVEECDQRFDEETCEAILAKINEVVPKAETEEGDEEEIKEEEE
uniref:DNA-directed RNA polymerase III subunit RPC9 n=1 Tax=Candidozyma auris TaxID=498019 RepID=A0A0L0NWY4_CANAR